ncbi:TIGR00341 family protein [Enterococcus sp. 669A]|uniref:TIGR00341 family protein n=1 Tax=Candidatus Enterococcus moelleringii TaxID=2815325 RepID=A0ABS3L6K4_9ENTE|nr:TIGR00341 family protein [Enterococcus sp. 669A]MBO1305248.1 TIGR00341 family protein [Enterococcus sp. 669A]
MNLKPDFISKEQLVENVDNDMEQTALVYAILVCATLMASVGLNYNSTTTIIGAMLISPLMSGISGIGFGLGFSRLDMAKRGTFIFLLQFAIILGISFLFFYLTPIKEPTPEITSRTSATIWDILVALLGGTALAISKTRAKDNNVVVGVSIGTSLILPLCVTGYGLSNGDFTTAWNSVKLFLINVFLICLAVFVVVWLLKYGSFEKRNLSRYALFVLPFLLIGGFFVYSTVDTTITEYRAKQFSETELADYFVLEQEISSSPKELQLTLVGETLEDSDVEVLQEKLSAYNLADHQLTIQTYSSREDGSFDASVLADIMNKQNEGTSKFLGLD